MGEGAWLVAFVVVQRLVELGLRNSIPDGCAHRVASNSALRPTPLMFARCTPHGWSDCGCSGTISISFTFWLAVFVLLQMGRLWVIASLGRRRTTRVIVLRGAARVALGPYRWLKHPNYWIVALEIAVVPLALGLPVFALVFSIANAALLV
jgi:methyltransferase